MSRQPILILGGGVAGSSMAYYLTCKGYEVTVIEKHSRVGGLARTLGTERLVDITIGGLPPLTLAIGATTKLPRPAWYWTPCTRA